MTIIWQDIVLTCFLNIHFKHFKHMRVLLFCLCYFLIIMSDNAELLYSYMNDINVNINV